MKSLVDLFLSRWFNYKNRARYFLDNVCPASYSLTNFIVAAKSILILPLITLAPPSFSNGRRSKWFRGFAAIWGEKAARNRFENGLIEAGIPESESPKHCIGKIMTEGVFERMAVLMTLLKYQ